MYSWVSWKACSFCKYYNSVDVVIFVSVCTEKKLLKIQTREEQRLHI